MLRPGKQSARAVLLFVRGHTLFVRRPKRSLAEFQSELDNCTPDKCTIIKCTVGPLEKDESVLFKVRSRLFTQTQVEVSIQRLEY